jgi:hypothetical protein
MKRIVFLASLLIGCGSSGSRASDPASGGSGGTSTGGTGNASSGGQSGSGSSTSTGGSGGSGTGGVDPGVAADWKTRASGPGVVWAHDFSNAAEVNAFRSVSSYGVDPDDTHGSTVKHLASAGPDGNGCLEISVPTGGSASGGWWRPMSAIRANDNGLPTDDLGANGTLPRREWNQDNPAQNWEWRTGYYGHPDYHAETPTWEGQSDVWDGSEFYVQLRVSISASRWTPGNPPGKLLFIDTTAETSNAEIVLISDPNGAGYWNETNPFRMYTSFGSNPNSALSDPQGDGTGASMQPGSPFESTCAIGAPTNQPGQCWEWPKDDWVTVLFHIVPGHDNEGHIYDPLDAWPEKDFAIEAWVAGATASEYTKIFEHHQLAWIYGSDVHPRGAFNSICPSAYMNNVAAVAGWSHRYDQIIFSKEPIPCPLPSG